MHKLEPALEYGASRGPTSLFVSGSYQRNRLGLASPDESANPLYDRAEQVDGFAFLDNIVDDERRVALILGLADDRFQIPNRRGLDASTTLDSRATLSRPAERRRVSSLHGEQLNDTRHETTRYAIASVLHTTDKASVQAAMFFRESTLALRANGGNPPRPEQPLERAPGVAPRPPATTALAALKVGGGQRPSS